VQKGTRGRWSPALEIGEAHGVELVDQRPLLLSCELSHPLAESIPLIKR